MSDTQLHAASSQWANRPADERFWTLRDMRMACETARANSAGARVPFADLRATTDGGENIMIQGRNGTPAKFTHYAFGQLCGAVSAPAGYLRQLPAATAADCLNVGLARASENDRTDRDLLFHKNGGLTLRACLSSRYDRVWDDEVCRMLERLEGWRAPAGRSNGMRDARNRAATAEDILPGQINIAPGVEITPSGLYASDHDMFAFLVAPDRVISDGAGGALMRGIFVRNSEVGDAALSVTFFLMQAVCGNHIVWNATGVHEIRVRHLGEGTLKRAFRGFEAELHRYRDSAANEEAGIIAARKMTLGVTKEEVLDALCKYAKTHSIPISRPKFAEAYETADEHTDWYGPPNTLWASVAGLTHASQKTGFADDRAVADKAAGKLMQMAF
jgi:Domain of unknown function (DUF932)